MQPQIRRKKKKKKDDSLKFPVTKNILLQFFHFRFHHHIDDVTEKLKTKDIPQLYSVALVVAFALPADIS